MDKTEKLSLEKQLKDLSSADECKPLAGLCQVCLFSIGFGWFYGGGGRSGATEWCVSEGSGREAGLC